VVFAQQTTPRHQALAAPADELLSDRAPVVRVTPPRSAVASGVHARVVALLQRPEARALRFELRGLLRLPDSTDAIMAAITAGIAEPSGEGERAHRPRI
jgi:hypothetical protein